MGGRITPAYFPPAGWHPWHPTYPARLAVVTEVKVKYTLLSSMSADIVIFGEHLAFFLKELIEKVFTA